MAGIESSSLPLNASPQQPLHLSAFVVFTLCCAPCPCVAASTLYRLLAALVPATPTGAVAAGGFAWFVSIGVTTCQLFGCSVVHSACMDPQKQPPVRRAHYSVWHLPLCCCMHTCAVGIDWLLLARLPWVCCVHAGVTCRRCMCCTPAATASYNPRVRLHSHCGGWQRQATHQNGSWNSGPGRC